jgi:hypothetical protein
MTKTDAGDTGTWCSCCAHMLVPHRGSWKHHSRDDWSRNAHGDIDCACVHTGRNCTPGNRNPGAKLPRRLGKRLDSVLYSDYPRGLHPDVIIHDELAVFTGFTAGHAITLSGRGTITFGPGAFYTGLSNALEED